MAIAFDTATDGGSTTSYSHICTGSNLILLVSVGVLTGNTPTVTYNSVSMTQLTSTASSIGFTFFTFYLINPSTGSNSVAISSTGAVKGSVSVSYTGVSQSGFPDSSSSTAATASPCTCTTTVVASNCWTVAFGWASCTSGTATISDDKTSRKTAAPVDNAPQWKYDVADSNGTVSTGSNSIAFTFGGGGTTRGNGTIMSLAPAVASGNSNFFSFF